MSQSTLAQAESGLSADIDAVRCECSAFARCPR